MARKVSNDILEALERLGRAEEAFLREAFLAPVVGDGSVAVRVAGVRLEMRQRPRRFAGWGVFRPVSHVECQLVRDATMAERRRYLDVLPAVTAVVYGRNRYGEWLAAPCPDARLRLAAPVAVRLEYAVEAFDTVVGRFDGASLWFDEVDARCDPAAASYLRQALMRPVEPKRLGRAGLTGEHRVAYALAYRDRLCELMADERLGGELRLRSALEHAGATLREFVETHGGYRVTYDVDGERHTSLVGRDMTVRSAGICLSGEDVKFDLASLVGVLREGREAW